MNGLASLSRYQMGGPVGYVTGGEIDSIYQSLFNRPADAEVRAYYEALLKDRSVADAIAIIGGGGATPVPTSVPTPVPTPGPNQILGIPTFARQTPGNLTFAPLRRGLAQLRPAMSMTGLTSGQAAFGGVAPTPVQPLGGVVRPPPATPYALPEDFVLQTGAYGAPTPTFLDRNSTAAGPAGVDQPTYAQLLDNVQRLSAQVQTLLPANRAFYDYGGGGGGGGF
jgi:hypothetical protein